MKFLNKHHDHKQRPDGSGETGTEGPKGLEGEACYWSLKVDFQFEESFSRFTKIKGTSLEMGSLTVEQLKVKIKFKFEFKSLESEVTNRRSEIADELSTKWQVWEFKNQLKKHRALSKRFKTIEIPIWTITSDFEVHGDFLRNYRSNFLEQPSGSLAVEQLKVKIKV